MADLAPLLPPKEKLVVQNMRWIAALVMCLAPGNLFTQTQPQVVDTNHIGPLDAGREKRALESLLKIVENMVVSAVDAMPADKFDFRPTDGEFKGVRMFGQMVKHLSATNHILAAAALGEEPPADAGDELGPEAIRTKAEILDYLNSSFAHLSKAVEAIGQTNVLTNTSPISPLKKGRSDPLCVDRGVVAACN